MRDLGGGGPANGNGGTKRVSGRLTRRQAQILALAAHGLSDKEIAKRLGVAFRTVRTHFEKLYRDQGVRNRSQAIAVWAARDMLDRPHRPADECPYPKPFPPDFMDCPAYQATQVVTLDLSHRPLGSVMTCRHLESRLMPNTNYRWYGACVLGDAAARRRVPQNAGAVPAVVRVRHQPALQMAARHDGSQRPVGEVQGDHLCRLVRGTVHKIGRKWLGIRALVRRPMRAI